MKTESAPKTPLATFYKTGIIEAGCDEVGRGCVAGPVVAAAVILPENFYHPLLNDSKMVSEKNRNVLADIIKEQAVAWSIAEIDNHEIDQINILQASFKAMHQAINNLSVTPELLLIDGHLFKPYLGISHVCIIKGDQKFTSIAAASILAKTHRDALMEQLHLEYPAYDWKQNKGYPTKKHKEGIKQIGYCNYHRRSYKINL